MNDLSGQPRLTNPAAAGVLIVSSLTVIAIGALMAFLLAGSAYTRTNPLDPLAAGVALALPGLIALIVWWNRPRLVMASAITIIPLMFLSWSPVFFPVLIPAMFLMWASGQNRHQQTPPPPSTGDVAGIGVLTALQLTTMYFGYIRGSYATTFGVAAVTLAIAVASIRQARDRTRPAATPQLA